MIGNNSQDIMDFHEHQSSAIATVLRLEIIQDGLQDHQDLGADIINIFSVIRKCYQQKDWGQVSLYRDALQPFLDLQGYWEESLSLYEWALKAAHARGDEVSATRWKHDRADILHQQGNYRDAERLYQECEENYHSLGEHEMALKSRHMRSMVMRAQGRIAGARHLCETTIHAAQELGLEQWLANPLYVLALLVRDEGDLDKAEHTMQDCLSRLDGSREMVLQGQCYHFMGDVALLQGDTRKSLPLLEISLELSEKAGIKRRIVATKRLLGRLALAEGRYTDAEKIFDEASQEAADLGDKPEMARLLVSKVRLMLQTQQWEEALSFLHSALIIYQDIGDARGVGGVSLLLIQTNLRHGRLIPTILASFNVFKMALHAGLLQPRALLNVLRFRVWWKSLS